MFRDVGELAKQEQNTVTWFSFRGNATSFGVFDTCADERGRRDHLGGRAADRLIEVAQTRLASAPVIVPVDLEMCGATSAGYVALRPAVHQLATPGVDTLDIELPFPRVWVAQEPDKRPGTAEAFVDAQRHQHRRGAHRRPR
jgi:hypothetical protein